MKKSLLTLSLIAFAFFSFANQSSLRIYTEEYSPFYIYLNGVRQNNSPTVDFEMNGLTNNSYSLRIQFAATFSNAILKNHLLVVDNYGRKGEAIYKVKENNQGKKVLRFIRFDVYSNFIPQQPIYSSCENQYEGSGSSTTIIQNGNGNTVIYTSSSSNSTSSNLNNSIAPNQFENMLNAIDNETFSDDQLQLSKRITRSNSLTANQIKRIARIFSFEDTRLNYLKFAYPFCRDKSNYWVVNDALTFSSSKRALNQFILH